MDGWMVKQNKAMCGSGVCEEENERKLTYVLT